MKENVEVGRSCKDKEVGEDFIFIDCVNNNNKLGPCSQ